MADVTLGQIEDVVGTMPLRDLEDVLHAAEHAPPVDLTAQLVRDIVTDLRQPHNGYHAIAAAHGVSHHQVRQVDEARRSRIAELSAHAEPMEPGELGELPAKG